MVCVCTCVYMHFSLCMCVCTSGMYVYRNHDIHVAFNSFSFSLKNDSWKSSVIYFMRICNTGVLLVSSGKISCDLVRVCSDDSHEYT